MSLLNLIQVPESISGSVVPLAMFVQSFKYLGWVNITVFLTTAGMFPMMLSLDQSDSDCITHTDILDKKQLLSLFESIDQSIYTTINLFIPLILAQSLFSLSPSRF